MDGHLWMSLLGPNPLSFTNIDHTSCVWELRTVVLAWCRRDLQEPTVAASAVASRLLPCIVIHYSPWALWSLCVLHNLAHREGRGKKKGGQGMEGEKKSIETVITNKKHLSHLCNLFSFNIRSMLVEICEFWSWLGRGAHGALWDCLSLLLLGFSRGIIHQTCTGVNPSPAPFLRVASCPGA